MDNRILVPDKEKNKVVVVVVVVVVGGGGEFGEGCRECYVEETWMTKLKMLTRKFGAIRT